MLLQLLEEGLLLHQHLVLKLNLLLLHGHVALLHGVLLSVHHASHWIVTPASTHTTATTTTSARRLLTVEFVLLFGIIGKFHRDTLITISEHLLVVPLEVSGGGGGLVGWGGLVTVLGGAGWWWRYCRGALVGTVLGGGW